MAHFQLLVLSALFIANSMAKFDYCDSRVCPKDPHVCCGLNGFDKSCDRAELVPMAKYKDLILDLSNDMRQQVASGKMKGFETASRMGAVSWFDLFAKIATCNCRSCNFEHDKCRNTPDYKYSGQNIYICMNEKRCRDPADAIRAAFAAWGGEYKICNMKRIKTGDTSICDGSGHFTQCIHDRATLIGCSLVRFWEDNWCKLYFVCNYNETNMKMQPVYGIGKPAADCQTGCHPKYRALCNSGENYDNTTTTTTKTKAKIHVHS